MNEKRCVAMRTVDVFGGSSLLGNPVTVVCQGEQFDSATMQRIANWTNLSETTFLVPPTDPRADYGVRIFTPHEELPFAGHPTLGSAHAWLESGGVPASASLADGSSRVIQQCAAGLVDVSMRPDRMLEFKAPPLVRFGPVDSDVRDRVIAQLGIVDDGTTPISWVDNGPGWIAVELPDPDQVLAITPSGMLGDGLNVGVFAWYGIPGSGLGPEGSDVEVRAFFQVGDESREDPVTGSLNASLGQLLFDGRMIRSGGSYVARQGTVLGRNGLVQVRAEGHDVWVGGTCTTLVLGTLTV